MEEAAGIKVLDLNNEKNAVINEQREVGPHGWAY